MKPKHQNMIWGILLILFGGFSLLQTMGLLPELRPFIWSGIFGGLSVLFVAVYLASGWQSWGFLFPIAAFAALAMVMVLVEIDAEGIWIGGLFMAAMALPFWLIFILDRRKNWWALIPGWVLAVLAGVILLSNAISGELLGALIMFGIGLPFVVVYLANRRHWWALIPGWAFAVLAGVILLSSAISGELLGALIMFGIGLPFLVVYLADRRHWWALIPAGVLGGLGVVILFVSQTPASWMGAFVLLIISLPFLFVYLRFPKQWWAAIPGGIVLWLAVISLLAGVVEEGRWAAYLLTLLTFWGMTLPFGVLWLRNQGEVREWAKYPLGILLVLGLIAPFMQEVPGGVTAVFLILLGLWLILGQPRRPKFKG